VALGMPISGLVIRLAEKRVELPSQIACDRRLTLGDLQEQRFLPAVLETSTLQESEAVVEGLLALEGILGVDIVTLDFSDNVYPSIEAP
jgi:hypothetical protein